MGIYNSQGRVYNVPDERLNDFLSKRKDAVLVPDTTSESQNASEIATPDIDNPANIHNSTTRFTSQGKVYDVPEDKIKAFVSNRKDAVQLFNNNNNNNNKPEPKITGFVENALQSSKAVIEHTKIIAAQAANAVTGSSKDAERALQLLDDYERQGVDINNMTARQLQTLQHQKDYESTLEQYKKDVSDWGERNKNIKDRILNQLPFSSDPFPEKPQNPY